MTKSGVHVLEVGPFFSPNMVQKGECCSQPTLSLLCGLLLSPRLCGRPRQGKSTRGRCRLGSWRLTRRWPRASRTASSARRSGRNPPALSPRNSPSLFWREALLRSVFALRVVMSSGVCALRLLLWLHFSVSLISLRLDKYKRGGDSSVNKRLTEIPDAILLWVWVSSVAIVFSLSQSQLSMQTLLWCWCSPHVQLHASTAVCTSKIPNIGSCTIVWTHKNTEHTVRNG